ncbi:MAG: septum formation initiator family protein [Desulfovibrio sp.]|nr:septum formation initiator family protein [Desulfovibrio sp.]MBR4747195.1 septum formation initiator family protein [Desulfovibrio sp.]MBR6467292.1 septum formation initiator family protein [Desulfovibrio sp.]
MFWRVFLLCAFALVNILLLYRMVWGTNGLVDYAALKEEHAQIASQIKALDSENRALSQEIRLLQNDPKYVEKMVRQRLHYLRANEVLYLFDAHSQPGARSDDRKN